MLDVDFQVPAGITVLFGASGSGKSTTLHLVAGLVEPERGRIAVGNDLFFDSSSKINLPIKERRVGYVFQQLALFPHLNVINNVAYGLHKLSKGERLQRASAMLEAFAIKHLAERRPNEISGGEAQRVALARALVTRPRLLLLDEPLSALDAIIKQSLIADLKRLNNELNIPILYVTHDRAEVITLGERVLVYSDGKIIAQGQPMDIFGAPAASSVARLAGVENILQGRVKARHTERGTMTCDFGGLEMEIPLTNAAAGETLTVAIRAGDILLAAEEPRRISARNILAGNITKIEEQDFRVLIEVDCGVALRAMLTHEARTELDLKIGRQVWLAIKTHACFILDSTG